MIVGISCDFHWSWSFPFLFVCGDVGHTFLDVESVISTSCRMVNSTWFQLLACSWRCKCIHWRQMPHTPATMLPCLGNGGTSGGRDSIEPFGSQLYGRYWWYGGLLHEVVQRWSSGGAIFCLIWHGWHGWKIRSFREKESNKWKTMWVKGVSMMFDVSMWWNDAWEIESLMCSFCFHRFQGDSMVEGSSRSFGWGITSHAADSSWEWLCIAREPTVKTQPAQQPAASFKDAKKPKAWEISDWNCGLWIRQLRTHDGVFWKTLICKGCGWPW